MCENEVISRYIVNINKFFDKLHWLCVMHNFYEITSQHIGIILQVHGYQKENSHIIFVNYGTFIILIN